MMDRIAILDFGAQYTQLIARRIRELGVYSEILPCTQPVDDVLAAGYKGIVLSGGPSSVYEDEAPLPDKRLFEAGIPLLGICYGMQAMGYLLGGHVVPAERREYGPAELRLLSTRGVARGHRPGAGWPDRGVDEPRGHGDAAAPRLRQSGRHRELPGRGDGGRRAPALRRPVPSRGRAYAAGEDHPAKLPPPLRRAGRLVDALVRRRRRGGHPPSGRPGSCPVRPVGGRGLVRRGRLDPPRHRRSAHLPVRRQWPAPEGRGSRAWWPRSGTPSR